MKLTSVHHIAVINSNYEKSYDFYVNRLGLKVIFDIERPAKNDRVLMLELTAPYVKVGGAVLAMKGAAGQEELAECKNAIRQLGLKLESVNEFPMDGTNHMVIVLRKVAPTPAKFPRRYAKIKASPL